MTMNPDACQIKAMLASSSANMRKLSTPCRVTLAAQFSTKSSHSQLTTVIMIVCKGAHRVTLPALLAAFDRNDCYQKTTSTHIGSFSMQQQDRPEHLIDCDGGEQALRQPVGAGAMPGAGRTAATPAPQDAGAPVSDGGELPNV